RAQTNGLDNELRQWLTEPGRTYPLLTATFAGREIQLYDFGPTSPSAGDVYRLPDGNLLFSSVPSSPGYSALRMIYDVAWIGSGPTQPVRSQGDLLGLVRRGAARLTATNTVVNLPVVPAGSSLERDPESRPLRSGWYDGQPVNYFDFGPARPSVMAASGECGNRASTSSVPGRPGYSDLWGMGNRVRNCPVVYVEGRPAPRTLIAQRETRPSARTPAAPAVPRASTRDVAQAAPPRPATPPVSEASASSTTTVAAQGA